jgi:hypothetical protein
MTTEPAKRTPLLKRRSSRPMPMLGTRFACSTASFEFQMDPLPACVTMREFDRLYMGPVEPRGLVRTVRLNSRVEPEAFLTTLAASIHRDRVMTERALYIPNQGHDRRLRHACSAIPSPACLSRHAARNS